MLPLSAFIFHFRSGAAFFLRASQLRYRHYDTFADADTGH